MSSENVRRSPRARSSPSAPFNPARRNKASTVSPQRGALSPTAAASAGSAAPKRPSSSRLHRKREFGGGVPSKLCVMRFSGWGASPSLAGGGGSLLECDSAPAAPRAGTDAKSQLAPSGAQRRTQRKLTPAGRRSTTRRICSRRGSPTGSVAARRRRRRADGPSPRASRVSRASQSLASNNASMAGLAFTTDPGGNRIASRALSASHSRGAPSGLKVAAACSRARGVRSAADDGGE